MRGKGGVSQNFQFWTNVINVEPNIEKMGLVCREVVDSIQVLIGCSKGSVQVEFIAI